MTKNIYDTFERDYGPSPERDLFVPDFQDREVLEGLTTEQVMDIAMWSAGALNTQIERRKKADEKAETDKLTGFRSKAAYEDLISRLDDTLRYHYVAEELDGDRRAETPEAFSLAAAFVDLDNFGVVNKVYNTSRGDEILAKVARSLAGVLRPGDDVYRRGGDEFVIFLRGELSDDDFEQIKRRLKEAAVAAIDDDAVLRDKVGLGASVGIGRSRNGELASDFIDRIDSEMQQDKQNKAVKHDKHKPVTV